MERVFHTKKRMYWLLLVIYSPWFSLDHKFNPWKTILSFSDLISWKPRMSNFTSVTMITNFTLPHLRQQLDQNTTTAIAKSCLPAQDKIMSLSHELRVFLAFCFAVFMISGSALNSTAVYVAWMTRQLKIRSICLMWYLCITDSFGSIITNGIYIIYMVLYNHVSCSGKLVLNALAQFFSFLSAYLVCYIGIDRYIRVKYTKRYNEKFTKLKFIVSMSICILLVVIQTTISIYCPIVYGEGYGALLNAPINIIVCVIVLICYSLSLYKLNEYNKKSRHLLTNSDRSLIKMASFHLLMLLCCYGPSVLYSILYRMGTFSGEAIGFSTAILFMLNSLHGILNAMIFLFVNRKNQKRFKRILKRFGLVSSRVNPVEDQSVSNNVEKSNGSSGASICVASTSASDGKVSSSNESNSTVVQEIRVSSVGDNDKRRKVTLTVSSSTFEWQLLYLQL